MKGAGEVELGPSTKLVSGHCVKERGERKTKGFNLKSRYLPKYWTVIVSIRKKSQNKTKCYNMRCLKRSLSFEILVLKFLSNTKHSVANNVLILANPHFAKLLHVIFVALQPVPHLPFDCSDNFGNSPR